MVRKILFGLLTALLALSLVGCGGDDSSGSDSAKKPAEKKVEGSADKAVLGYAQLYAYGIADDDALKATGLDAKTVEEAQVEIIGPLLESFRQFPLSEESAQAITTQYITKLQQAMEIKTAVKKDDAEKPVVELTATTIDNDAANEMAKENEDLITLGATMAELQSQGMTEEQLKENEEFQTFALECIDKFIDAIPLNAETSIDITCAAVEGEDGKVYWAPVDATEVAKFVTGQK